MSKQAQHPKPLPSGHSIEALKKSADRRSMLQPKAAAPNPQCSVQRQTRTPAAPPLYKPQPAPQAAQAKMRATTQPAPARAAVRAGGVLQANIIGGTHALQARLAFLKHTPNQHGAAQSIQRKSGPGVEAFQVPLQPKSGGQPMPDQVRAKMEAAFGMDFSDVRVHVGQEAASIGAIAYTWGTNIHFAPGQYNPNTIQGQKLLGHELWHVVQQKSGRVSNPFGSGVAVVQDHALEAEADRMGVKAAMTSVVSRPGPDLLQMKAAVSSHLQPKKKEAPQLLKKPHVIRRAQTKATIQGVLTLGGQLLKTLNKFQAKAYLEMDDSGARVRFKNNSLVFTFLAAKVEKRVKASYSSASRADIVRVLHKYLDSPAKGRFTAGILKKDFEVPSWDGLADQIVYELRSEQNYFKEIDLAEVIVRSAKVMYSFDQAIMGLRLCVEKFLATLKSVNAKVSEQMDVYGETGGLASSGLKAKKHYRPYVPGLDKHSLATAKGANIEQKISIVHDLLQMAWDILKEVVENEKLSEMLSITKHPLQTDTKAQTGEETGKKYFFTGPEVTTEVFKPRSDVVDKLAITFAKSKGRPSEMGPSYTTVRFCNINNLFKSLKSFTTLDIKPLSPDTMTCLVWGIFAYWTLYYHKAISGAHCFFEINEAAKQMGYPLSPSQTYPSVEELAARLGVSTAKSYLNTVSQKLRRRAVMVGLDQAIIANTDELVWTDDVYHVRRARYTGEKISAYGKWHEDPPAPENLEELIERGWGGS